MEEKILLPHVKTSKLDPITKKYKLTFEIENNSLSNKLYYRYKVSNYVLFGIPIENSKYLYDLSSNSTSTSTNFSNMFFNYSTNVNYIPTKPIYQYFEDTFFSESTTTPTTTPSLAELQANKKNELLLIKKIFFKLNEGTPTNFCKIIDMTKLELSSTDNSKYTTFKTNDIEPCPHDDLCNFGNKIKNNIDLVLIIGSIVIILLLIYILFLVSSRNEKKVNNDIQSLTIS